MTKAGTKKVKSIKIEQTKMAITMMKIIIISNNNNNHDNNNYNKNQNW